MILKLFDVPRFIEYHKIDPEYLPLQIKDLLTENPERITLSEFIEYISVTRRRVPDEKYTGLEIARFRLAYKTYRLKLF